MTAHAGLKQWVEEVRALCTPDRVHWCDGSREEYEALLAGLVASGAAIRLNPDKRPGSYLFRSDPSDVARVENRTFVATSRREDAGPNNNWVAPEELKATLKGLFSGCMRGRTMYVVPFVMGPKGSPAALVGVEITDSAYVAVNMRHMTRMGSQALSELGDDGAFIPCLHSVGAPHKPDEQDVPWPCAPMEQKYIAHFPEEGSIWSYGSGYGGNALLGKKCLALRIASAKAREEGWLAEHMLILGLSDDAGRKSWLAAAFPSACGKTNLAMMVPALPGYRVETIGDDIAWLRRGADGSLRAINPEAGFFGVAPGTSFDTNPNAMRTIAADTLFTNVALTDEGDVWWEGMGVPAPPHLMDWQGRDWHPGDDRPAAHPNARFTVSAARCPAISPEWQNPQGVPISAILLGGRRPDVVPLVMAAKSWAQGVFLGSFMGSQITAATISDQQGKVRRDPFAMLPFIGYDLGRYLRHWLEVPRWLDPQHLPRLFMVNWFQKDEQGRFRWPGFGDNVRVLDWALRLTRGEAQAVDSPAGLLPAPGELRLEGLEAVDEAALLKVDAAAWAKEAWDIRAYFDGIPGLPAELYAQLDALEDALGQFEG